MAFFTPFAEYRDDVRERLYRKAKPSKIDRPIAERTLMLFRRDGTSFPVTLRLGAPFVGKAQKPPAQPEYCCATQIVGIGDERVIAPWGEDPFVALQYAIDLLGNRLDDFVRRENFEIRFRSGEDKQKWIWRYPPY